MPGWPAGWKRATYRQRAKFGDKTIHGASQLVIYELKRIGARDVRIDTDLRTRNDGGFISAQRNPEDPGVVVYFTTPHGRKVAMPCDKWDRVEHNLYAIAQTLEAKRAVERWGCASMDAEYEGYAALPAGPSTTTRAPHDVLGIQATASDAEAQVVFRALALKHHPDRGGDPNAFREVQEAWDLWRIQHA